MAADEPIRYIARVESLAQANATDGQLASRDGPPSEPNRHIAGAASE